MPDPSPARQQDEIYVGYLPVPPRQRRFLRRSVPVTLWILCAASFLWARSQHTPAAAVWEDGQPIKLHGLVISDPYPILFTVDGSGASQAILLVEAGKHGSHKRFAGLNGRAATVSGWPLHRDGRRMLELEPTGAAVSADAASPLSVPPPAMKPVGAVTLRGEIVDSKCFLGAMKPGEGKTHKECATLCIRGGIPPMFVTRDAAGAATYYLLQDPSGGPIDPAMFPLIADPIEINADLATWGDQNVLKVRPESIRRL
jgi:hypothetical protein